MQTIAILGTGCAKCKQLAANAEAAVAASGAAAEVVKVTDLNEIMAYGVMMTPALAIDGDVKLTGKVATPDEIAALLG